MRTPRSDVLPPSDDLRILALDVTNPVSIQQAIATAGPFDALVNNAGFGAGSPIELTPIKLELEAFHSVNIGDPHSWDRRTIRSVTAYRCVSMPRLSSPKAEFRTLLCTLAGGGGCGRRTTKMNGVPVQQILTADEARVIGSLMEKSVLTPDQYPMTLNALTGACNQKTGRNPVVSMDPGLVQRTARDLQAKHFVRIEENFRRGVEKYKQRLCNTTHSDYQFDAAEFAIVCLLLLRGPQTPGELRAHSGRLHGFADNSEVIAALRRLIERDDGPLVVQLARTPGRKDSEYMHLLSGPVDAEVVAQAAAPSAAAHRSQPTSLMELAERVSRLEAQLAALRARLGDEDEDESPAGGETGA